MNKKIELMTAMALALAVGAATAAEQKSGAFLQQQAMAEVQRVTGQMDVMQTNFEDLSQRLAKIESANGNAALNSEIDALKASIAELRREMRNMHDEIVKELTAKIVQINKITAPAPAPAPTPRPRPAYTGSCKTYVVEGGDTLSLIAQAFNTKVSILKDINNLRSDALRVGQKLLVPQPKE